MPIGDLLAQIEGKTVASPVPSKRKAADDEPREAVVVRKALRPNPPPRHIATASRPIQSSNPGSSSTPSRSYVPSHGAKPATLNARPSERPSPVMRKPASTQLASRFLPSSSNDKPSAAVLSPAAPADGVPKAPPKKGSYAEIMARASRAQSMKPTGSIQHKPIEKGLSKKEREEARIEHMRKTKEEARLGRKVGSGVRPGQPSGLSSRPGSAPPSASRNGISTGYKGTARAPTKATTGGKKTAGPPLEPEKKVKKTALAATGYQGTARPQTAPPQRSRPSGGKSPATSGRTGQRPQEPKSAFSAFTRRPKPKYDDDEDSEMDDFIVDDEDEEDDCRGGRYNYASDGSSDMEAGIDDVWNEEEKAARIARLEDAAEEALLKRRAEEKARRLGRR